MIKTYEVTVAETRYKTLIVNAENESAAEHLAEDAYYAGEYGFDDSPVLDVLEVSPANDTIYQVTYCDCSESTEDSNIDDFLFDDEDEDEDIIFTCERCALRESCDNETKLRHMLDMLLGDFMERVDMVCATYGDKQ